MVSPLHLSPSSFFRPRNTCFTLPMVLPRSLRSQADCDIWRTWAAGVGHAFESMRSSDASEDRKTPEISGN